MRKISIFALLFVGVIAVTAFTKNNLTKERGLLQEANFFVKKAQYRDKKQSAFKIGEKVEYIMTYGVLGQIANAYIRIESGYFDVNNRTCYKMRVRGRTEGTFTEKLGFRVDDTWISYIDTKAITSQRFFRFIAENQFRRKEYIYMNPLANQVLMDFEQYTVEDKRIMPKGAAESPEFVMKESDKKKYSKEQKYIDLPETLRDGDGLFYVQDLVSGYYYLRTVDMDALQVGEVVKIPAIFEQWTYDFGITYRGKEKVKVNGKTVTAHKFAPVMDEFDNDLFKGKDSLFFWVSDDGNKVPLLVEAKIFLGTVSLELVKSESLQNPANF